MTETSRIDFDDLTPVEVPVRIGGKDYLLREASADAAVKFKNAQARSVRYEDGKMASLDGVGDLEPLLVSLCLVELYETRDAGNQPVTRERPVPLVDVRRWPARVIRPLFDRAKEISDLDDDRVEMLERQLRQLEFRAGRMPESERERCRALLAGTAARLAKTLPARNGAEEDPAKNGHCAGATSSGSPAS